MKKVKTSLVTISCLFTLFGFSSDSLYTKSIELRSAGKLDSALVVNLRALDQFTLSEDNHGRGLCYKNWGVLLSILEDYSESVQKQHKAIELFDSDSLSVGKCHNNIGAVYLKMGEIDSAFTHLTHAKRLKLSAGVSVASTNQNLAIALGKLGDYQQSINLLKEVVQEDPDNRGKDALNSIGKDFWNLGELDSAAYYFTLALNTSIASNKRIVIRNLRDVYIEAGKLDSLSKYVAIHDVLCDSLGAQNMRETVAKLGAIYKNEQGQREIAELQLSNTIKTAFIFGSISLAIILLLLLYIFQQMRINKQRTIGREIHLGKKFDKEKFSRHLRATAGKISTAVAGLNYLEPSIETMDYLTAAAKEFEKLSNEYYLWYLKDSETLVIALESLQESIDPHLIVKVQGSTEQPKQYWSDLFEMTEKQILHFVTQTEAESIAVDIKLNGGFEVDLSVKTDSQNNPPSTLLSSAFALAQNLGAKTEVKKVSTGYTTKLKLND